MRNMVVILATIAALSSLACRPTPTPLPTPTPITVSHVLVVIASPEHAADFLFNPKAIGQGLFVHGRTVTIDVLLQPGWEIDEWVGPVFGVEGRTAKIKME